MEKARRTKRARRRPSVVGAPTGGKPAAGAIKLAVCAVLFVIAALLKILFPGAITYIGDKVTAAVDYKSALEALGEGISGEKKLASAVGEAFTHAFGTAGEDSAGNFEADADDEAFDAFEERVSGEAEPKDVQTEDIQQSGEQTDAVEDEVSESELSKAIVSAFLQTQEGFSDYTLPAGTTFEMPTIGISFLAPLEGKVTSPFGYRIHPDDGQVKFHYGTDIAAPAGSGIISVADGAVTAVGESTSLGKYIIIAHENVVSQYAHCSEVFVSSGQAVRAGEHIAAVGDTGNATSPCLHFELKADDVFVNPEYYIAFS